MPEHRSIALSKRIGDAINARYHAVIRGSKRGVATPKTDRFIELEIPPAYRQNLRGMSASSAPSPWSSRRVAAMARLELLGRQLADPVTAPRRPSASRRSGRMRW